MKLYQILIILCTLACGGNESPVPSVPAGSEESVRPQYLALGDSYTIGQSVSTDERWPVILAEELKRNGKPVATPQIIARTGWTTRNLLDALEESPPAQTYDLVSLLIGVNNQYQGRNKEEYRIEFRQLLLKSIAYAGNDAGNVFVLSIPDWGVTAMGEGNREHIAAEINDFNAIAKDECSKLKITFIDITDISRKALNNPSMIAGDQLHFSGKMYRLWVNEALPQVKQLF
ncbi:lysophospholipase [Dyadobacter endophyticus]|uniref:Lysophospholipase n=1 Tax=Dyadobacter endophyticus TaxID=1749036 RepID=A0ABQ1YFJ2_9BACT|nr:SGNH/GDSL hydrolase family protein [Dyadobacter endophyticus]GGH23891.1 lysophospholipase [Dyadobacter endophyticus]